MSETIFFYTAIYTTTLMLTGLLLTMGGVPGSAGEGGSWLAKTNKQNVWLRARLFRCLIVQAYCPVECMRSSQGSTQTD